ncbi:hypothetical protein LDC_1290 [sediment metagenome]|uniref:Uncharacterized protein n=1 Tax=sediment metagenome TaxID=749907 RepID=D9PID4_9ZZZZ
MAQGDVTWFNAAKAKLGLAVINLETDVLKLGLVTSSVTPTASTADPCWGAGGTTNLSSYEVTPGGNYSAGGPTVANNTFAESGGTATLDADNTSIAQSGSNPTNARWGILYSDTSTNNDALAFVDLGGVTDLSSGGFSITWNASGIMTLA